jgi:hypothetical protein
LRTTGQNFILSPAKLNVIYLDHNATTPIGPEVLVQAGIPAVKQAAASLRN